MTDDASPSAKGQMTIASEDKREEHDILDPAAARADDQYQPDASGARNRDARPEGEQGPAASSTPDDRRKDAKTLPKAPPKTVFLMVALLLLAGLGWGAYTHWRDYTASKSTAAETVERPINVRTTAAKRQDQPFALTLPGQTDAFEMANIYARATGYIGERRVDIGSRVKQGDLLVHIVAPDLDQQLAQAEAQIGQSRAARVQAEAQVTQAQANMALAKVTFARTNTLTNQGYETQQNRDNQQANLDAQQGNVQSALAGVGVADANIKAQQATIDRLKALAAFEDVRAPFDGVITARTVDTGDLLNADTMTTTPMFNIARTDVIRVTVRVPQSDALGVTEGIAAEVTVPQMPGRTFKGTVTRSSNALLYSSRTLTTEVDVPNPDDALRVGLYVSVTLHVPRSEPDISVPAEALLYNQNGMQVAVVEGQQAQLHQITIYRDHGTTVDVKAGLNGSERVILEPPATLADGSRIEEHREEDEKKPNGQADTKQANASDPGQAKQ